MRHIQKFVYVFTILFPSLSPPHQPTTRLFVRWFARTHHHQPKGNHFIFTYREIYCLESKHWRWKFSFHFLSCTKTTSLMSKWVEWSGVEWTMLHAYQHESFHIAICVMLDRKRANERMSEQRIDWKNKRMVNVVYAYICDWIGLCRLHRMSTSSSSSSSSSLSSYAERKL